MSGAGRRRAGRWLLDLRVWLGIAITALALWVAFRDVAFGDLKRDLAQARPLWLLCLGVPGNIWALYVRSQRWRYLTRGVVRVGAGPSFRATAVGFMVNNLFPLRMGEFVRAWVLAREVRASGAALLGTLIVERAIDVVFVLGIGVVLVGPEGARAAGVRPAVVLVPVLGLVAGILGAVLALRLAPERILSCIHRVGGRFLPARFREGAEQLAGSLVQGLSGIRSWGDFARVLFHSALLWGVAVPLTFWAAIKAFHLDLGGLIPELLASGRLMAWVGLAVALPSAPGFFGPYHAACRMALAPLGVPSALALALGTAAHATFWVTITLLGLAVLRLRGGGLADALEQGQRAGDLPPGVPPSG